MRPPPSDVIVPDPPAAHTAVRLPLPEPPAGLDACDLRPCRWIPPASRSPVSADFEANAIMVLIVLLCALVCALALQAAIRCFLRGSDGGSSEPAHPEPTASSNGSEPDQKPAVVRAPPVAYSLGLGLAGAECAICLTEFEEGVGVRVLRRCRHGFHAECIERWLSAHPSCPNCRGSCFPTAESCSSSCKQSPELGERREDSGEDRGGRQSRVPELASSSE